jgi:DNA-binding MarR family transcriptional regulator
MTGEPTGEAAGVPWLNPDERRSWLALMALLEVLPASMDAQLKRDADLNRFEYMILAGLSEAPGRARPMSELAAFAVGSISRMSHAVSRLQRQGLVERRPHPTDGRHIDVALTEAGWGTVQQAAPGHVREARRIVVDVLTPTQLAQLGRIARAIVGTASPHLSVLLDDC